MNQPAALRQRLLDAEVAFLAIRDNDALTAFSGMWTTLCNDYQQAHNAGLVDAELEAFAVRIFTRVAILGESLASLEEEAAAMQAALVNDLNVFFAAMPPPPILGHRGGDYGPQFDDGGAAGTDSGEGYKATSCYLSALSFLRNNKDEQKRPIDEQQVQNAYRKAYIEARPFDLSASLLGSAAAMHVFQQLTSGGSSGGSRATSSTSRGSESTRLIRSAMEEALRLFDAYGDQCSGNRQDAINNAAMTAKKLLIQSRRTARPSRRG